MTILNATVAPTCAVIAQDSRVTRPDGGLLGYTGKLIILTDRGFAVGRRGSLKFTEAWAAEVKETQHLTLEDADATADALRRLSRRIECSPEGHGVAHVGWSRVTNAPMGFYFDGASNFEPQHLIPGVHLRGPAVLALDEPDYPALAAMSVPAANGERMEDFHIALAKNQFQADRRGLLGMVGNIGGTLTLAVIDATGIRSRTINAFPFEPLPAAVTVADIMIREQFKFLQDS